jgi:acyl dehydratase
LHERHPLTVVDECFVVAELFGRTGEGARDRREVTLWHLYTIRRDVNEPGRITDEGIARLRARIGVAEPHPLPPYYTLPTHDTFRNVAIAYGDDNPLWCDASYGPKTRWEQSIASPALVGGDTLIGEDEVTRVADEHRELMKGDPLRGVHAFYAASAREWWAPLYPLSRTYRRNALVAALDKPSEFAERAVHEWTAQVFRDEHGSILSGQYRLMVRTERTKARERKKYDAVELQPYTDEQIDEIEAAYARESARGSEPRWWEDVAVGDEVGPMVKGPLTVTDMICWHAGMGMGLYGVKPLRLGYQNRTRIPRFFHRDDLNVPDVMQRVHWDPEFARRSGNPTTFDYGRMRETWLIHCCTDWMGDDAWLWKLDCEFRRFNYVGDTHWLRGRITKKYLANGDRPAVDLELSAENQRGEQTTPGHATILLPSREHGAVRLPDPPGGASDLQQALEAISAEFNRR